jgi:hypothetical protein
LGTCANTEQVPWRGRGSVGDEAIWAFDRKKRDCFAPFGRSQ